VQVIPALRAGGTCVRGGASPEKGGGGRKEAPDIGGKGRPLGKKKKELQLMIMRGNPILHAGEGLIEIFRSRGRGGKKEAFKEIALGTKRH